METTPDLSGKWIKYGDTRWSTGDTMTIPIDPPEKLEQSFYRVKVNELERYNEFISHAPG